jgi:hypothetical protein
MVRKYRVETSNHTKQDEMATALPILDIQEPGVGERWAGVAATLGGMTSLVATRD